MDENLNIIPLLVWELLNFLSGGGGPDINIRRTRKSEVERKINTLQPQTVIQDYYNLQKKSDLSLQINLLT